MSKLKTVVLTAALVAAAGCAQAPFQGCPAGKPPVAPAPAPVTPPPPPPAPAPIAPVQKTVLESKPITITGINFKFNSSKLLDRDIKVLDEVAEFAQKHPDAVINVNGYASKVGTYAYNLKLSQQRAESVARYLEQHGVPRDRMVLKGHSYEDPIASNATPQGRFENQRVEINSTIQVEKTVQQ
ncbi:MULTISPECIES: OmpA family protein [Acidithiobacillus]|jgi:outer membrane protein OmpA-like peptidoglycan-associated protein|uniref:Outer membrane protein n=4 Tax=Acidithiobacillus caldus TaxID=33059 RepID=F9ZTM9_ACICS|nr:MULTISPECIES: OmpA family protein [Acidithiobacillus]AEK59414.1 outer membrane protein [Acidithiobacillus caldus SM-1]AIA56456.1 outer membrane protein, OmpA/MotB family [Acidithiobacillus caldus ATCC 51756]AUW33783.1 OmpA family protein [Acidithiobacillus caldus]MBU2729029.1 OmpA family protein [Acidithiobacillus caldus]MBU2734461.1 OmpA family protein [Acidithiobacillus caldus ATCC 51756]